MSALPAAGHSLASQVCAVVVTWHPDPTALRDLLQAVLPQVGHVLVVDNATPGEALPLLTAALPGCTLLRNRENRGVAAAVNQGAVWARARGARFLLCLDQDSLPAADMVERLLAAWQALSARHRVGAVGPQFLDLNNDRPAPFVRIGFPFNRKLPARDGQPVEADFLITSGCLIPLEVLEATGPMDEALFIDNVDVEWSFRARRHGYRLYGVPTACMRHRIGDHARRLGWGLGEVVVHSPSRLYYMMRNRLLLYRRRATPRVWILQDVPRLALKLLRLGLFVPPRLANSRAMLLGIVDGLRGVSGPAPRRIHAGR
ncbi:glycosyltransferase family 2 protein [Vulcaniibacterium gelatinicum]|uniref:glycosyltransferase family 2 protein n=1 Tax=Vulcaniibacterium gelatinicum TaxID=2598725 RepID=UPI001FEC81D8|nr:glycosyltransferase family 2 protein [Vulcaniibacterium gelatinicum]